MCSTLAGYTLARNTPNTKSWLFKVLFVLIAVYFSLAFSALCQSVASLTFVGTKSMQRGVRKTFAIYNIERSEALRQREGGNTNLLWNGLVWLSAQLWRGGNNHNSVFVFCLRFRIDSLLYLHFACDKAR